MSPLSLLLTIGFPGLNVIVPLFLWLKWRKKSEELNELGKKILNTQVSYCLYIFCSYYISTLPGCESMLTVTLLVWMIMIFYTLLNIVRITISHVGYRDPCALTLFR